MFDTPKVAGALQVIRRAVLFSREYYFLLFGTLFHTPKVAGALQEHYNPAGTLFGHIEEILPDFYDRNFEFNKYTLTASLLPTFKLLSNPCRHR